MAKAKKTAKATQRYAALLRGVSPMNAKMSELKTCFESAGFTQVKTVLASGNVVFDARPAPEAELERAIRRAMAKSLGREFLTLVRSVEALEAVLEADPYAGRKLPAGTKRVVTFLRETPARVPRLPIEVDGARILAVQGREVFTAYVPSPRGAVFMQLLEKTFGTEATTRSWDTIRKVASA